MQYDHLGQQPFAGDGLRWKRSLGSVKLRDFISLNIEQHATNFRFLNTTNINILEYVILFYELTVYYAQ